MSRDNTVRAQDVEPFLMRGAPPSSLAYLSLSAMDRALLVSTVRFAFDHLVCLWVEGSACTNEDINSCAKHSEWSTSRSEINVNPTESTHHVTPCCSVNVQVSTFFEKHSGVSPNLLAENVPLKVPPLPVSCIL